jgi:hypothetical protein
VPDDKAPRLRNYIVTMRQELAELARTVGVVHPGLVPADAIEIVDERASSRSLSDLYGIAPDACLPHRRDVNEIVAIMSGAQPTD